MPYIPSSAPESACAFVGDRSTVLRESLVRPGKDQSLVVSVQLLRRSISIRLEGYDIELVPLLYQS